MSASNENGVNTNSALTLTDASRVMPLPPACSVAEPPTCTVFEVTAKNPLTLILAGPWLPRSSVIGCSLGKLGGGVYAGWKPPIEKTKFGWSPQVTRIAICPDTGNPLITESCRAASIENVLFGKSSSPSIERFSLTSAASGFGSRHFTSPRITTTGPGISRMIPISPVMSVGVPHPSFPSGPNT